MNSKIESALAEWLVSSGILTPMHTGLDIETLPVDEQAVIAAVSNCERKAGRLYIATVTLVVASPHHVTTLDAHRELDSAIADLIDEAGEGTLPAKLTDEGLTYAGVCLMESDNDVEGGRWLSSYTVRLGLAKN